jgi:hypothetical protein
VDPSKALASIPSGLRTPLLDEYKSIIQNYLERRWSPAELSGGHFCEIVYTILDGHAKGKFASSPSKPKDFVSACRKLESNKHVPRSFQILIPRMLPSLYEIRNNRGVGHVGGDVDPNHMDATVVVGMCNWIMAEIVRVLHGLSIDAAQALVDQLTERRIPLVWQGKNMKRVLDPKMSLKDQVLILADSAPGPLSVDQVRTWCGAKDKSYFLRILRGLHKKRMIELSEDDSTIEILPPGSTHVAGILSKASVSAK